VRRSTNQVTGGHRATPLEWAVPMQPVDLQFRSETGRLLTLSVADALRSRSLDAARASDTVRSRLSESSEGSMMTQVESRIRPVGALQAPCLQIHVRSVSRETLPTTSRYAQVHVRGGQDASSVVFRACHRLQQAHGRAQSLAEPSCRPRLRRAARSTGGARLSGCVMAFTPRIPVVGSPPRPPRSWARLLVVIVARP
jgi:hypothetical protein